MILEVGPKSKPVIEFMLKIKHYIYKMSWIKKLKPVLIFVLLLSAYPLAVQAAQSSSTNYQVNEVFMGAGGELRACSTNYCAKQSAGELAVGNTKSTNYQAWAGFNTDRGPFIQFSTSGTAVDVGELNSTSTKTANATFSVTAYLASGYSIINASDPPVYNGNFLTNLTIPTSSIVGNEQFGINLKANTLPVAFGADPVQVPSGTYGFGQAASGYDVTNQYKYVKNDTIALSGQSSSITNYTVSYIFNAKKSTVAGVYVFNHLLVAVGYY